MQAIARELNISETVFLEPPREGGDVRARIFTPATEVPFAGHPTLGSAIVHGLERRAPLVALETAAGTVPVEIDWNGGAPFGWMTQPQPSWGPFEPSQELLGALDVHDALLPIEAYSNGPLFAIVVLDSQGALAALAPDPAALRQFGALGVYCAARSGGAWEARMFAPGYGVAEDPATGSGAGLFATHLVRHGLAAPGEEIEIHQGLRIGRPSLLRARVGGSADAITHVEVGGSAVVVGRGELSV